LRQVAQYVERTQVGMRGGAGGKGNGGHWWNYKRVVVFYLGEGV
jgi:hypothetical protein